MNNITLFSIYTYNKYYSFSSNQKEFIKLCFHFLFVFLVNGNKNKSYRESKKLGHFFAKQCGNKRESNKKVIEVEIFVHRGDFVHPKGQTK